MSSGLQAVAAANALGAIGGSGSTKLWASVLQEVPLFANVSKRHVRKIAGLAREARFRPESTIVRAGEPGNDFFVIIDGDATVHVPGKRRAISVGPGSYFGEMSLVDGGERSATVIARTEVFCLKLSRAPFTKLLKSEPDVALALLRELSTRVRGSQAASTP
jgi:CRP-like cAMP-binding protein